MTYRTRSKTLAVYQQTAPVDTNHTEDCSAAFQRCSLVDEICVVGVLKELKLKENLPPRAKIDLKHDIVGSLRWTLSGSRAMTQAISIGMRF